MMGLWAFCCINKKNAAALPWCAQPRQQIYKGVLRSELAAMKEARKAHAVDALMARVVSAGAISAKTRYA